MRRFLVLVLALSFLLSGCGDETDLRKVDYHEGSDGLVFSFTDNSPPEKVYPNQLYPVTIRVHNKGAFSIMPYEETEELYAEASLVYDSMYFTEDSVSRQMADRTRGHLFFEGKSAFWPTGESRTVTIGYLKPGELPQQRLGADTTIGVSLCYPYETELATELCVDYDPYDDSGRMQPCEAEDMSFEDQGAPIAVKRVEVESLPAGVSPVESDGLFGSEGVETKMKPVFRLYLENVGGGRLVRAREWDEQELCFRDLDNDFPSRSVRLYAKLGGKDLECKPEVPVFHDGKAEAICTLPDEDVLVGTSNYVSILEVFADYVYKVQSSVEVEIDDSLGQYEHITSELSCRDFDGSYKNCAAFGDGECAYCRSNERCFKAGECDRCPGALDYDKELSKCVAPCAEDPSVSLDLSDDRRSVTITCRDGPSVENHDRCGCDAIQYKFALDKGGCELLNAQYEENEQRGEMVRGDTMRLEADVIDSVIRELQANETRFICARGVRQDDVAGPHRALRLLKPSE